MSCGLTVYSVICYGMRELALVGRATRASSADYGNLASLIAGTTTAWPHCGHLTFRPARSALTLRVLPQEEHGKVRGGVTAADSAGRSVPGGRAARRASSARRPLR